MNASYAHLGGFNDANRQAAKEAKHRAARAATAYTDMRTATRRCTIPPQTAWKLVGAAATSRFMYLRHTDAEVLRSVQKVYRSSCNRGVRITAKTHYSARWPCR